MPVLVLPIFIPKGEKKKEKIGVIQVLNPKGIEQLILNDANTSNASKSLFTDTMKNYAMVVGMGLANLLYKDKIATFSSFNTQYDL